MEIKTKADIGQKVYVMHQEQIREVTIFGISIVVEGTEVNISYGVPGAQLEGQSGNARFFEHEVYLSTEDLVADLIGLMHVLPTPKVAEPEAVKEEVAN